MRCRIFGRLLEVIREKGTWRTYLVGQEGKKRLLSDIFIPASVSEGEIPGYLEDLLHEYAAPHSDLKHGKVKEV